MKHLLLPLIFLSITSCSSVSKNDCAEKDWSTKAQEDLRVGRNWKKRLAGYEKVCSKYGYSVKEAYMNGIQSKGGKSCTGFEDYSQKGWRGVGVRDALSSSLPGVEKYALPCAKLKIKVNSALYNEGVKSVGARACASFDSFDELGWAGVGARDARQGRVNNLIRYIDRCRAHYFTEVDQIDFTKGYQEGLKTFCTKRSGYDFAKSGGAYKKTCTHSERSFLKGFKIGASVRAADLIEQEYKESISRIDEISKNISSWHSEIENLNVELASELNSYKVNKAAIESSIKTNMLSLENEVDPIKREAFKETLEGLKSDAVELEEKTANSQLSNKRLVEEARFSISKLKEERRKIDVKVPVLESRFKAARAKAEKSLKSL